MQQKDQMADVTDIVAVSWENLVKNFKLYLEFAVWTAAIGLILWLLNFLINQSVDSRTTAKVIIAIVSVPFSLALMILTVALIHATWQTLSRRPAHFRTSISVGLKLLVPFIWLSVLTGILLIILPGSIFGTAYLSVSLLKPYMAQYFWVYVTMISLLVTIGGAIAMVMFYLFLPIYFSTNYLTIDGIRGWACLSKCVQVIQGRWWKTFWRLAVSGIFFWLATQLAIKSLSMIVGWAFGNPGMLFNVWTENTTGSLLQMTIILTIAQLIYGLAAPLFVAANMIVWNDLKRLEDKKI